MPYNPPEHEMMEGCKELLQGRLPLTSSPLGSCHETVSYCLPVSDEVWGFLSCDPQNSAAAYKSTQLWSRFDSSVMEYPKTRVSVVQPLLFLCCLLGYVDNDLGSWHLWLILLCTVYISIKLSNSRSSSLCLY